MRLFKHNFRLTVWGLVLATCLAAVWVGRAYAAGQTYNFVGVNQANSGDGTNPIATEHDSDQFPWDAAGDQNDNQEATNGDYGFIDADDTAQWVTDDPGLLDIMVTRFEFYIQEPIAILNNIHIRWSGNTDDANNINHFMWAHQTGTSEFAAANWDQLGGATQINQDVDTDVARDITTGFATYVNATTGAFVFAVSEAQTSADMRINYVEIVTETAIDISGPSDLADSTSVAVAVNGAVQPETGVVLNGSFSIEDVIDIPFDAVITVWAVVGSDANESTAVAKATGLADITGMTLNRHVLSVGSDENQSLSMTELAQYENSDDNNVMFEVTGSLLIVDADSVYSDEALNILAGNTFSLISAEDVETYDLTVAGTMGTGGYVQANDVTVSGSFGLADYLTANDVTVTGMMTVGGTIGVGGSWDVSGVFSRADTTITFTSTSAETITTGGYGFYDIDFNGSGGSWVLQDDLDITGSLVISQGTLDAKTGAANTITVGSYWTNTGAFEARDSSVILNSTATVNVTSGGDAFYDVSFDGSTGTYILADALDVNNDLMLNSGTLDVNASGNYMINVAGDWLSTSNFLARTGTVTFDATAGAPTITSNADPFYNLSFDDGGNNRNFTLQDDLDINGTLTIDGGTLDVNSSGDYTINIAGNWTDNDTFTARNGLVIFDGDDQSVTTSETFYDFSKSVTVTGTLTVAAGATITVGGAMSLSGAPGQLLGLASDSGGSAFTFDVSGGTQTVTYVSVKDSNASSNDINAVLSEDRGGNDNGSGTPEWVFLNARYWVGSPGGNTSDTNSWAGMEGACGSGPAAVPTTAEVAIFTSSCTNNATVDAAFNVGGIELQSGYSGTVTTNALVDVNGPFSISGGTWDTNTNDTNMNVSNNYIVLGGTVDSGTGILTLDGTQIINDAAGSTDLGNVVIAARVTMINDLTAASLTINSANRLITRGYDIDLSGAADLNGTLNATNGVGGNTTINIAGDWDVTGGTFTNTNTTVIFDGNSDVTSAGSSFNHVQIGTSTAGGTLTTADDMDINGDLTVGSAASTTLNISNDTLFMGGNLDLANLDTFTVTNSTVDFDGNVAQTVASNALTYNVIEVSNTTFDGVSFTEAFTTDDLVDFEPNSTMKFQQSTTFTITGSLSLVGNNVVSISLNSIDDSTQFTFNSTTGHQRVEYVRVAHSNAAGFNITAENSTDNGGNDNGTGTPEWIFPDPDGYGQAIYTTAGTGTFDVPCGVTSIVVKAWGGGGGGGGGGSLGDGGEGGGGAFVQGTYTVTPGEALVVHVGGGGTGGGTVSGGGGGGGGGGRSEMARGSTVLLTAGGGGGGGGGDNSSATEGGDGGAAGGTTGATGSASSSAGGGTGGTTSGATGSGGSAGTGGVNSGTAGAFNAGGDGGNGGGGGDGTGSGAAGGATNGGTAGIGAAGAYGAGGGGGSGRYGGGGGSSALGADAGGGGGGGGSSYVIGASPSTVDGSGTMAGNNMDDDYSGDAGRGGDGGALDSTGTDGTTGRIVITYIAEAVDISGTSDLSDGTLVKIAVNDMLCTPQGTVTSGAWSIENAPVGASEVATIWAEDGDGDIATADEATSVAIWDGVGTMTGMILNRHQLTLGSNDNQIFTLYDLSLYTNSDDEDVMHMTTSGTTLIVDGDGSYTDDVLRILSGNTLTVSSPDGIITHDLDLDGVLTLTGTIALSGDWDSTGGTFTNTGSTVTFNGASADQNITPNGENFYNLVISNTASAGSDDVIPDEALDVNGTFTITDGDLDLAANNVGMTVAGNFVGTGGTITSTGTITFDATTSRTLATNSVSLPNVDFDGSSGTWVLEEGLDVNGTLRLSDGSLDANVTENNTVRVSGAWVNRGGTFVERAGTVVLDGNDQELIGSEDFYNLTKAVTIAGTLTFDSTGSFTVANTLNLSGISGQELGLVSSNPGSDWYIAVNGGQQIASFVNVRDSEVVGTSGNDILGVLSVDGGGNDTADPSPHWLFVNSYYWVGTAGGNTSTASNWSATEAACGGGTPAAVPSANEIAVFTNSCVNNATVDATFNVGGILIESGHTGTITPNALIDVDGPFNMNGGTIDFSVNDTDITISGNVTINAGSVTAGTGSLTLDGDLLYYDISDTDFGSVYIGSTANTITLTSTLLASEVNIVSGNTLFTDGYEVDVNGNITINGTLDATDGTDGNTTVFVAGDWDMTSGDFVNTNTTVAFDGTSNVTSNGKPFNHVQIGTSTAGGSLATADDLYIDGDLTVGTAATTTFDISNDTVYSSANFDLGNLDTFTVTSGTVQFDGTVLQTVASESNTYNVLEVTNQSAFGVNFTEAFTTADLVATIQDVRMQFLQSTTFTVTGSLNLVGVLNGEVVLNSIDGSTQFVLDVTNQDQQVEYVKVANSDAASFDITAYNSVDDGGNDNGGSSPFWIFPDPDGFGTIAFTVAGNNNFTVPCGVTDITVKAWGGGGGGGAGGSVGAGGAGGGAAYAEAELSVAPGEVLTVHVGGGGTGGSTAGNAGGGGGGGGRSEVERSATPLIVAGGGGGGGGGDNSSATAGGAGGAGGGATGIDGSDSSTSGGGGGGTTSGASGSGGAAGTGGENDGVAGDLETGGDGANGGGGGNGTGSGAAGGATNGGTAGSGVNNYGSGGGGGSGRYGGGGGSSALGGNAGGGGGGGGSSYTTGSSTSTTDGSGTSAGNNADSDYAGSAGMGGAAGGLGAAGTSGNSGRVVITYVASAVDVFGVSDLTDNTTIVLAIEGTLCSGFSGPVLAGSFAIQNAPIFSGDTITAWAEDGDGDIAAADEATGVTRWDGVGAITNLTVNRHVLSIGSADNATITVADMSHYDNNNDEDIMYGISGNVMQVDFNNSYTDESLNIISGNTLQVLTGFGAVAHDVDINGVLDLDGTFGFSGDWDSTGGTLAAATTSTVTVQGTMDQSIISATESFYNLVINNTGAPGSDDITLADALDVNGSLSITDGDLDANTNDVQINVGSNWVMGGSGSFDEGTSTVVFDAATGSATITSSSESFYNINFASSGAGTATFVLQDALGVEGTLVLTTGTLDANISGDYAVSLNGNWRNNGGTFAARAGTVTLTGGDQAVYGSTIFYSLTKTDVADDTDVTLTFETGSTQGITGTLTLDGVDADDRIILDNTGTATRFNLNVVNYSPVLSYLVVSNSEALGNDITANNSSDLSNNDSGEGSPMWIFPGNGPKRGAIIMVD
ncbi:MAG: hypothetical protein KC897_00635 [Candidatus Omnitrophica bacterium]|nr:hypothetical protein [Candidatus Omnitrophota bacterium]